MSSPILVTTEDVDPTPGQSAAREWDAHTLGRGGDVYLHRIAYAAGYDAALKAKPSRMEQQIAEIHSSLCDPPQDKRLLNAARAVVEASYPSHHPNDLSAAILALEGVVKP